MTDEQSPTAYLSITADIVASYVANNRTAVTEIPALIGTVHRALTSAASPAPAPEAAAELKPAVSVRKSIQDEHLISLEDGRKYKTLKRHLAGLGLTPDEYRAKWGLPKDYPMVAPSYARRRSELAKAAGLGQLRKNAQPEPEPAPASSPAKKSRGRKKSVA